MENAQPCLSVITVTSPWNPHWLLSNDGFPLWGPATFTLRSLSYPVPLCSAVFSFPYLSISEHDRKTSGRLMGIVLEMHGGRKPAILNWLASQVRVRFRTLFCFVIDPGFWVQLAFTPLSFFFCISIFFPFFLFPFFPFFFPAHSLSTSLFFFPDLLCEWTCQATPGSDERRP